MPLGSPSIAPDAFDDLDRLVGPVGADPVGDRRPGRLVVERGAAHVSTRATARFVSVVAIATAMLGPDALGPLRPLVLDRLDQREGLLQIEGCEEPGDGAPVEARSACGGELRGVLRRLLDQLAAGVGSAQLDQDRAGLGHRQWSDRAGSGRAPGPPPPRRTAAPSSGSVSANRSASACKTDWLAESGF